MSKLYLGRIAVQVCKGATLTYEVGLVWGEGQRGHIARMVQLGHHLFLLPVPHLELFIPPARRHNVFVRGGEGHGIHDAIVSLQHSELALTPEVIDAGRVVAQGYDDEVGCTGGEGKAGGVGGATEHRDTGFAAGPHGTCGVIKLYTYVLHGMDEQTCAYATT